MTLSADKIWKIWTALPTDLLDFRLRGNDGTGHLIGPLLLGCADKGKGGKMGMAEAKRKGFEL
jgi:hypothetical protein